MLTAVLPGFTRVERREVVLNADDRSAVRLELSIASQSESVSVTAEAQKTSRSPAVSTVVDRRFVENMPLNGRSFQSLLELAPGVVQAPGSGGQFSVNGQRASSNYFTVDGVSANARGGSNGLPGEAASGQTPAFTVLGTTNGLVSVDALQEFRIQTSTYAPEFGRTPGGQVSLVTRSGTNRYSGSAFEYFRDEAMDATDWFINNRGFDKPELRQHDFGGVLGGPILKNRTFAFGSYEGLRLRQPKAGLSTVPSLALRRSVALGLQPYLSAWPEPNGRELNGGLAEYVASYSDPSAFDATSVRIDHNVSSGIKLFNRISHTPSSSVVNTQSTSRLSGDRNTSITGGMTWVISNKVVHELRMNYTSNRGEARNDITEINGASAPPQSIFGPYRSPETGTFGVTFTGCCSWSWGTLSAFEQRQINLVDSLTISSRSHEIKTGVDIRRTNPLFSAGGSTSAAIVFNAAGLASGRATSLSISDQDPSRRSVVFDNISFYAQDSWRVHSRTTVTYGLRWEFVPPASAATGPQAVTLSNTDDPYGGNVRLAPLGTDLWQNRYNNFAPRVGATYEFSDDPGAQMVVKGGFGVFYDLGLGHVANAFYTYPFIASRLVTAPTFPLAAETLSPVDFSTSMPTQIYMMDPALVLPRTYQWNVSLDRSLGTRQLISISYVGASGKKLLKNDRYSINLVDTPTVRTFLNVNRNRGYSDYHALQAQFQTRSFKGFQSLVSYTWSQSRDTASSDGSVNVPAERLPPSTDYGYSDYDLRHVVNAAITYQVGPAVGSTLRRLLASDWGVDLIIRARSGYPLNVTTSVPFPPGTQSVRPNVVVGQPFWLADSVAPGGRRLNPSAFAIPAPETQGDLRRGQIRGFSARQVDAALRRELRLTERLRLQLRAEMFNLFNSPNFLDPNGTLADVTFGQSLGMLSRSGGVNAVYQVGGARSSQVAAKFLF